VSWPSAGQWAIGRDRRVAEALLQAAQKRGLRTAWLGPEAGFLSNLNVLENLRLIYDWQYSSSPDFADELTRAQTMAGFQNAVWLTQRPAQLSAAQRHQARVLRFFLLKPDVCVLDTADFADTVAAALRSIESPEPRWLFLLDEAGENWPGLSSPSSMDAS
jgi:ABC-type lipopolysaccharide export system ATPase subunit